MHFGLRIHPRGFPRAIVVAVLGCVVWSISLASLPAAEEFRTRMFDLPAGDAARSLKLFSQQSGRGVIAADEAITGVSTKAVKGRMTPRAAVDQMLVQTGLVATLDEKTGAFAVRRGANAVPTSSQAVTQQTPGESQKKKRPQPPAPANR